MCFHKLLNQILIYYQISMNDKVIDFHTLHIYNILKAKLLLFIDFKSHRWCVRVISTFLWSH